MDEILRIRHQLGPHIRMRIQISVQLGVLLHVIVILHDRRVSGQVIANVGVTAEKSTEACHVIAHRVVIAQVRIAVVHLGLLHEGGRILPQLLADAGVVLEVGLQGRMAIYKLPIIEERRISADLFRNFAVIIEEAVKIGRDPIHRIPVVDIAILAACIATVGILIPVVAPVGIAILIPSISVTILIGRISAIGITILSAGVTVTHVRVTVVAVCETHEGVRILPDLVANSRIVAEVSLQSRMALYPFPIVQQGRIFANLFGDFTVLVEESIETRRIPVHGLPAVCIAVAILVHRALAVGITILVRGTLTSGITILIRIPAICISAVGIAILAARITIAKVRVACVEIFESHERVGTLADLLLHARVILEICIQFGMAAQELRVVHQRRRFAELFCDVAMAIQKLIEARQIPARNVVAWVSLPVLRALHSLPVLGGCRLRLRWARDPEQRQRRRPQNENSRIRESS